MGYQRLFLVVRVEFLACITVFAHFADVVIDVGPVDTFPGQASTLLNAQMSFMKFY